MRLPSLISSLVALLSLSSIVGSVGSTLSPVPAPASSPIAAAEAEAPTNSPVESSNKTIYNDGGIHVVDDEETSFKHESVIVTDNSTLRLEANGYIYSPDNSDGWPAVRLKIGGVLNGTGGSVTGSLATGDNIDGGEAIEMYNGQYSPKTASYAYFYDGINVIGGDAPNGVGGNALHVNGFGTQAYIYGGHFIGGSGTKDNGLSLYVFNSGRAHIRAGLFTGDMKVERSGSVAFYGCFMKNGTKVTGVFADESELDITVRTYYGGEVILIPLAEQECDTAPSASPTNFPTLSPQPTVPRPNLGGKRKVASGFIIMAVFTVMQSDVMW
mmetsp:Transcript_32000/g.67273  ORF Transcript_32000/g.67273 Transcript_32000/m.67273 type:complete len:327 (-) Transcript_32000:292-1272(-)